MTYTKINKSFISKAKSSEFANPYLENAGMAVGSSGSVSNAEQPADLSKFLALDSTREQNIKSDVKVTGNLTLEGNVVQLGKMYETHAEHVFSTNDLITLRDQAANNLQDNAFTGFEAKRVFNDGSNGYLVYGNDGMARVGKKEGLQMLATREDSPTDESLQIWNSAKKSLKSWKAIDQIWTKDNLNRSDVDFVANKLTAISLTLQNDNILSTKGSYLNFKSGGNELVIGGGTDMHVNYREADGGTPKTWLWHNGTSSSYSDFVLNSVRSGNSDGSGFTASGWRIGEYSNLKDVDVRGRLMTYEFVQNKININNGNILVSDSAKSYLAIPNIRQNDAGEEIKYVEYRTLDEQPFKVGDIIQIRANGKLIESPVVYTEKNTVYIEDDYAYDNCTDDDLLVRVNSNDPDRKGLLYLNSSDTNAPNFQVLYDGQVKGCFGNCAGLNWLGFALPSNSWGTWIENGWFSGSINANSGNIAGWKITSNELSRYNGNNGLVLSNDGIGTYYYGSGWKNKLSYDGSGLLASGNISWDAQGNVTFADSVKLQWTSYDYAAGEKLYTDEFFAGGSNSINIYNNAANGNVTHSLISKSSDCPNPNGKMLRIQFNGSASPAFGGFYFGTSSYGGAKFITRFIAKFPVGMTVNFASNAIGNNSNVRWLTPQRGTGKFEEYRCLVECGTDGSFNSTNFFYLDGSNSGWGFLMDLASATVYDITKPNKQLTKIDSNGIYTGTINANQINTQGILVTKNDLSGYASQDSLNSAFNGINSINNKVNGINNTIGNRFTYIDSNGIYTGTLTAEQIKANLAAIGGFTITNNNLTCSTADRTFSLDANAGLLKVAGLGTHSAGQTIIGFTQGTTSNNRNIFSNATFDAPEDSSELNIYTSIYARGYLNKGTAIYSEGRIVTSKSCMEFGYEYVPIYSNETRPLHIYNSRNFLIYATTGAVSIPPIKDIAAVLGITIFDDFRLRITITGRYDSSRFRVYSNSDFGNVFKGYDGQNVSNFDMAGGDTTTIDLYYHNRTRWAQIVQQVN